MPQSQNEIAIEDSTGNARDDQTLESKPAAVILGENLVDLFVSEDSAIRAIPGGGPLNVARTISRLKGHSYLFSRLSWDVFGRKIRVGLQKDGVILGLPDEIQLPTPLAVVNQDQGKTTYGFHLDRTSAFQINTDEVSAFMDQCKRPIGAIYAGTLGLVVEPMASVAEVILSSAAEDTLVVIDPNCRPTAIADKDLYIARLTRLYKRCDVIKVSDEDLDYLFPGLEIANAAKSLLAQGPRCILVTRGGAPIEIYIGDQTAFVEIPIVRIADTVGAGDAFVGGFIAWWLKSKLSRNEINDIGQVTKAAKAAALIAALNCTKQGAEPPWAPEVSSIEGWSDL